LRIAIRLTSSDVSQFINIFLNKEVNHYLISSLVLVSNIRLAIKSSLYQAIQLKSSWKDQVLNIKTLLN